jgi:hypothetical protein
MMRTQSPNEGLGIKLGVQLSRDCQLAQNQGVHRAAQHSTAQHSTHTVDEQRLGLLVAGVGGAAAVSAQLPALRQHPEASSSAC